jgi:apolipoprotein N-acyltransferase
MTALADRVAHARGWRRVLLALSAGAGGALAMPPFGALPALAVSLTVAVWLLDGASAEGRSLSATLRSAALAGWIWGFGYFVAGLWWLGAAFLVEADLFAWAMPLGVLGLPAVLAVFPALSFALARALWSPGAARLFAFAFGLASSEWLRGHLFTGFPWNILGMALGQNLWLMQAASVVGLYGLTVLSVILCSAPATWGTGVTGRERAGPTVAAVLAVAALTAFGAFRLPSDPAPTVAGVALRIMQPNVPQDAKFNPANRDDIMRRYLALSGRAPSPRAMAAGDVTHLIWPESAFPFLLERDATALGQIAALLPPGTTLITGAARAEEPGPEEERARYYNAVQVLTDDGTIAASYDKAHLVPFGEYLPGAFEALLRGLSLREFVRVPGGFEPGGTRSALVVPGLPPVAATICYEAIFPGAVLPSGPRPELILNVTNDAWFGNTPGPRQHFAQSRLRAVEEGVPLVRAANSGISAVVDPYGRVIGALPLDVADVLDSSLPRAIPPTPFSLFGNVLFGAMVLACALVAVLARRAPWPVSTLARGSA